MRFPTASEGKQKQELSIKITMLDKKETMEAEGTVPLDHITIVDHL